MTYVIGAVNAPFLAVFDLDAGKAITLSDTTHRTSVDPTNPKDVEQVHACRAIKVEQANPAS
jgi:hypothetical protein